MKDFIPWLQTSCSGSLIYFRKKRRQWILEQIKEGKLHKSALIWVNSTKVLPFEREEKKKNGHTENSMEIDHASSGNESEGFDPDFLLEEAVQSISKDSRAHMKRPNFSNENWNGHLIVAFFMYGVKINP